MLKKIIICGFFLSALISEEVNATVSSGWERHPIGSQSKPIYLYVADLDRDGDLDVVSTTNQHPNLFISEVAWFQNNLNQNAPWEKYLIDSSTGVDPITNANGVVVADIDADGYQDVALATGRVTKYEGGVYWYKAPADPTGVWERFTLEEGIIDSYFKIYALDVNGDDKQDLIVGGRKGAVIFVNPGNPGEEGAIWKKYQISQQPGETGSSIYLEDINSDGRLDILNTLLHGNVSWIDVLYQEGQFLFTRTIIDSNLDNAFDVNSLDVNGDSKKDVLVSVFTEHYIYWYENPSSLEEPWIRYLVTDTYSGTDLYTGDINQDGKTDFVVSGLNDMKISWFEYHWESGQALWTEHLIDDNINQPGDISLNDLDGDGDLDVVVCGLMEDQMIWYENKLTPPTLIMLSEFTAIPGAFEITLKWVTETEIDNAGFNLYRSTSENGEYVRINGTLIPARGSAVEGAAYGFRDNEVKNRERYYYKLEDIDIQGKSTFHGPVSATPKLIQEKGR